MNLHLSDEYYILFRDLISARCGLNYPERKRDDLVHSLSRVMQISAITNLATLYAAVLQGGSTWELLLQHLTIGETYFFRNRPQFDALQQHILPDLMRQKAATRSLRIWSAGCATGEEPYSLAISISEMPAMESWHVHILATDINTAFLRQASEGLYGPWSFRETTESLRSRYFVPEQGRWRLCSDIRQRVVFTRLNLAEAVYPSIATGTCALDMIFCRNVMIYFDEATTRQVVGRFYEALAPGGWLFVGHAEPQASIYHQFEVHNFPNTVVYRKAQNAPLFAFNTALPLRSAPPTPTNTPIQTKRTPPAQPAVRPANAAPLPPSPAPSVAEQWANATTLLAQGQKTEAEALLQTLLRQDATHVPTLTALARLCADRGDWAGAQRYGEQALVGDPLHVPAHYLLAQVYEHQGQIDAALAAYRRTVYLDRHFVAGMIGMANTWRQMGQHDQARRAYRSAARQLALLDANDPVPGTEGARVGELRAFVTQQLQSLE